MIPSGESEYLAERLGVVSAAARGLHVGIVIPVERMLSSYQVAEGFLMLCYGFGRLGGE
jgi:hypothetical protein